MGIILVKDLETIKSWYVDIPNINFEIKDSYEEYRMSGKEIRLILNVVDNLDNACHALLDLGDIDYFQGEKLALLNAWIEKNYKSDNEDLNEILRKLKEYVEKAIELDSGVIIEL